MELPVVGMVGAGQLARMTHQAGIGIGLSLRILAADPSESAALIAHDVHIGDYTELATLRQFAHGCTVVTFDHEHVPAAHIRALEKQGIAVYPSSEALIHTQDKLVLRRRLAELGLPNPRWTAASSLAEVMTFGNDCGWPIVAKAPQGGYDGKGVWQLPDPEHARPLLDNLDTLLLEERVQLRRELAVVAARSPFGQVATWPLVETVQHDGVCVQVLAPAPDVDPQLALSAQQLAITLATQLGVVGVMAVELFELAHGSDPQLIINELAMRPHNSAHWTIDGSATSQFEQHLRACLDYPLGTTTMLAPVAVMANVFGGQSAMMSLDERLHHLFAADPGVKVHLYGKQPRPGRKLGHVTVLGNDLIMTRKRAVTAARWLREGRQ